MDEQHDKFRCLYDLMPSQTVRTIFNVPSIWFRDLSDRKVAIDAISLLLKSMPGILAIISLFLFSFTAYSYKSFVNFFNKYTILSVSFIIFFLGVSFLYIINTYLNKRLMNRLSKIDHHRQFKIRQYVFLCNVKNDLEAEYAYRYIVKAKDDFVDSFPAIFSWTGHGNIKLHPRNRLYTTRHSGKVAGGARRIDIIFDEPMRKNEERVIEYTIETKADSDHKPLMHIGLSVFNKKYPQFNTFLKVVFSKEFPAIAVYRDYFFGGYAAGRLKNVAVGLDDEFTHFWDLRFRVNWAYCIRWEL